MRTQKTESFFTRLSELLHDAPPDTDVNTQCTHCCLHTAAGERLDIVDSRSQHGSMKNVARHELRRTMNTRPH